MPPRRRVTIAVKNMERPLTTDHPRWSRSYHLIQRATDAADGAAQQKLLISCAVGKGTLNCVP
jgi:hypothetical protein